MTADLTVLAQRLEDPALNYLDIFGRKPSELRHNYLRLVRMLHPDGKPDHDQDLASSAFQRLQELYAQACAALDAGTYGQPPVTHIKTRRHSHEIYGSLGAGDITNIYAGTTDGARSFFKIGMDRGVNDLLEQEAKALRLLHENTKIEQLHPYFPKLLDSFRYEDRRANVFERLDGFYTLRQVRDCYPDGLNPLDAVWMWRRLLVALSATHATGLVHGAILPEHVMIHPEQHGLVLVDWCYSRETGQSLVAASRRYSFMYPTEELVDKQPADSSTDIFMAANTMLYLVERTAPKGIRAFLKACTTGRQSLRPGNAATLLETFDALLERLGDPYYPRRFREFRMPKEG